MPTPILHRLAPLLTVVLTLLLAGGCVQRNVERISAEEAATLPPPPPPQAAAPAVAATPAPTTRISGTVDISPDLTVPVPGNATLYLIVRVAGRETGAPLAVKQLPAPSFPYSFEITERDSMIENTPLVGEMSITARLDQDGDAFTTSPGDLAGQASPVVAGDSDVIVLLQEVAAGGGGS